MAYTPIVLTEVGDFDEVRYLLGIDSTTLPDAVVGSFAFLGSVEILIQNMANSWLANGFSIIATEAGEDWDLLRLATMRMVAARLATNYLTMRVGSGFTAGGYSETGISTAWGSRASQLNDEAAVELSKVGRRSHGIPESWVATGPTSSGAKVPAYAEEWVEQVQPRFLDWVEEGGEDDDYVSTGG